MPWLLSDSMDQRHISWSTRDASWALSGSVGIGEPEYNHRPDSDKLYFQQESKHKRLPDLMNGTPSRNFFVGAKMKRLIDEAGPFKHHFIPIAVRTSSKDIVDDQFYLFKHGDYIHDGIIEAKSDVKPGVFGGTLKFYGTPAHPTITWRKEKIAGHHFFTDWYLKGRIFVSDDFIEDIENAGLTTSLMKTRSFAE